MGNESEIDALEGLEASMDGASLVTSEFTGRLNELRASVDTTSKEVDTLSKGIAKGLRRAFDGLAFDGMKLSDALNTVAKSMIDTAYSAAIKPVTDHFGGLLAQGVNGLVQGILPFEKGGSFSQGRVMPFAKGGIVSSPTNFPMRGGIGLMGEAGPEAIMPLSRGADGRLGVKTSGNARPIQVVMNVSTPDVVGFQRSQAQIAAQMSRALGRGHRNR